MKKNKLSNKNHEQNQNSPIEISEQELNWIRARETSRIRRKGIEWFSL